MNVRRLLIAAAAWMFWFVFLQIIGLDLSNIAISMWSFVVGWVISRATE